MRLEKKNIIHLKHEHPGKLEDIEAVAEMDQRCFDTKSDLYSKENKEAYKKMRAHHGI